MGYEGEPSGECEYLPMLLLFKVLDPELLLNFGNYFAVNTAPYPRSLETPSIGMMHSSFYVHSLPTSASSSYVAEGRLTDLKIIIILVKCLQPVPFSILVSLILEKLLEKF